MRAYSLRKNLQYMAMAFVRPTSLIEGFLQESSVLYGVVPFVIEKALYEVLYLWDYLEKRSVVYKVIPIPDSSYHLYKTIFAPIVEVADLLLFVGVIVLLARLHGYQEFDAVKTVSFFMFTFTVSLVALVADAIYQVYPQAFLMFAHPLAGFIALAYMTAFIRIRVKVARKPALPPHIGSVTASAPQDTGVRWRFRLYYVLLLPQCLYT